MSRVKDNLRLELFSSYQILCRKSNWCVLTLSPQLQDVSVLRFPNHNCVFLCLGPSTASREAGGERPFRPVPPVERSGLWTAVPRLPRKQEKRKGHQEAVGEVGVSARLARLRPFSSLCFLARDRQSVSFCPQDPSQPVGQSGPRSQPRAGRLQERGLQSDGGTETGPIREHTVRGTHTHTH